MSKPRFAVAFFVLIGVLGTVRLGERITADRPEPRMMCQPLALGGPAIPVEQIGPDLYWRDSNGIGRKIDHSSSHQWRCRPEESK